MNEFEQAIHFHQQGDLTQAKALYQKIIADNPKHADAHHLMGLAYAQEDDFRQAITSIQQSRECL